MDCLEIVADVNFLKPIPDYSDIECTQRVLAFVVGECPPDEQIRGLEAFRRVVLRLVEEGLRHEPGCSASDLPYVSLTLKAGEECGELVWNLSFFISINDEGVCRLEFNGDEDARFELDFVRSEDALASVKDMLDKETGRWAAQVSFELERAGM